MSSGLSAFITPKGEAAFVSAYSTVLKLWPVPYREIDALTRFGSTHVIVSGSEGSPPLVLLHATGVSASSWFPNIADWSRSYRTYAVDIVGEPGKSKQSQLLRSRSDCGAWMSDLMDVLHLETACLAGASYGAWHTLNFALHSPARIGKIALLAPSAGILPFKWATRLFLRIMPRLPFKPDGRIALRSLMSKGFAPNEAFVEQFALGVKHFRYPDPGRSIFPGVYSDEELRSVSVPTLLLVGEHEFIYDPRVALERFQRLIPNVETELISNAGHLLAIEQPQVVNARVLRFLEQKSVR